MPPEATPPQEIRFCRAPDGVRIAYAIHGQGPPLVISTCWLSHLQHDWESPVWRHFLAELGRFATVIRFDERGHGLSDRDVESFDLEARIADLEAVVADSGVGRFALMAMAQGGPVSIEYAVRHPDRVTRLLFYGSSPATLPDPTPEQLEAHEVFDGMVRIGWARPESSFRRVFTTMMIPGATEDQMRWLDELQRVAVSAETLCAARLARRPTDARHLLPGITVPTLVLHSRGDQMVPFARAVMLAAAVPRARMVDLDSSNHIVLEDEPAWQVFVAEVEAFLAPDGEPGGAEAPARSSAAPPPDPDPGLASLTTREREVLELASRGHHNDAIAEGLTLSVRTVERHLQNVYVKLDVRGRSARTAAVARLLTSA